MIPNAFTCTGSYAILILCGIKRTANRSAWPEPREGQAAISCSQQFCKEEYGQFIVQASVNLTPEDFEKLPAWREVKDWPGKVLGVVNKCNRGIAKANRELGRNGNPKAQFDVNKLTEFRVTVLACSESGQIKWHDKPKSGQISSECGQIKPESGQRKTESGQIKPESGQINSESGTINHVKPYDTDAQDRAVLEVIRNHPGIKLDAIFLEIKTSTRSVRRVLERLSANDKIEYRGSKRTGGWFINT